MPKPTVYLDNHDIDQETISAWDALVSWVREFNDQPPLMTRSEKLYSFTGSEIVETSEASLRLMLGKAATFAVTNAQGVDVPKYPPVEHVRILIDREWPKSPLPSLSFMTDIPILDSTGQLIAKPGLYESGVFYMPTAIENVEKHINDVSQIDDVVEARDFLLSELLGDFDFADEASRANALALLLLPFVREYIGDSPTPLHLVVAPQSGSGKTTLIETCLSVGLGTVNVSSKPNDEDELRKKITSIFQDGERYVLLDNLNDTVAGSVLAAALTAPRWADRLLGKTEHLTFPNRLIWTATGNNLTASDELSDRICLIELMPKDGVPARQRARRRGSFAHDDLKLWAAQNRARLAGACLTLVLHWAEGRAYPKPDGTFVREDGKTSGPGMGSFNRWSTTMGGILEAADVHGFMTNYGKLSTSNIDELETKQFFETLLEWSGGVEFDTKTLTSLCVWGGQLHELVPGNVGDLSRNPGHRLGRWLAGHRDATYGGVRLRMRKGDGGKAVWKVEKL